MTVWLLKSILASQWSFEPTQFSSELDHVGPFLQVWLRKENLIQVKGQCFTCKWSCWPNLVALLVTTHPISSYGVYWSRYELFWVSQVSWRVSAKEMPLCSISIQFSPHVPPSLLHNWYCIPMCMAVNDEHGQLRCLRMHHCDPLEHIWISEGVHKGLHSVYARMLMLTHLFRQMLNNWTGLQLYHFGNLWMHGTEISWDARNLDILMAGDAKTQRVKDLGPGTIEMCCDLKWKTRQRASPYEGRMLSPCLLRNHNDFCEPANQRHESKKSLCPWWFLELFWITWSFKILKFSQKSSSNDFIWFHGHCKDPFPSSDTFICCRLGWVDMDPPDARSQVHLGVGILKTQLLPESKKMY